MTWISKKRSSSLANSKINQNWRLKKQRPNLKNWLRKQEQSRKKIHTGIRFFNWIIDWLCIYQKDQFHTVGVGTVYGTVGACRRKVIFLSLQYFFRNLVGTSTVFIWLFSGLWIRIHFMRIRIQQFFWMRIRIQVQLNQIWRKKSWRVFSSCKKHKRLLKSKKQWSLCKFTFKKLNKLAVISNFLTFFCF